ncbi:MAG: right-handed parallel beta-helix repeat-containing protein [Planctomycetota bacterium]|nr:right-handed parallel beta-helix repeat-containing protein [Planctomycetota bacterium]
MTKIILTISLLLVSAITAVTLPVADPQANPAELNAGDYPTLQAALDALPETGGRLVIPAGTYEISEPLRLTKGDIRIEGAGNATHIVNKNEKGGTALLIAHEKGKDITTDERLWRIQIANLRLTGNEKSGHGIHAILINEIFLHNVTVSYHGGDGVLLDFCYEDARVADCLITYNKQVGLNLPGCHDIVVAANQFEENNDALKVSDGYNLCMTGNNLDDHLRHGVIIENTYGSVVSGNMIEECQGTAIILDRDCYGNTLSANVIAHNGAGVDLRDAHGIAVSANTFTLMTEPALAISAESGRIAVTGNNFCNSYIGGGDVRRNTDDLAAAGIELASTNHIAISGNVFSSLQTKALELKDEPSKSVLFSNNVLVDVQSDHPALQEDDSNDISGPNLVADDLSVPTP